MWRGVKRAGDCEMSPDIEAVAERRRCGGKEGVMTQPGSFN